VLDGSPPAGFTSICCDSILVASINASFRGGGWLAEPDVSQLHRGVLFSIADVFRRGRLLDLGAIFDSRLRPIAQKWVLTTTAAGGRGEGDQHDCEYAFATEFGDFHCGNLMPLLTTNDKDDGAQ
jgi:hypothetical protein